jgi:hypothetical protein
MFEREQPIQPMKERLLFSTASDWLSCVLFKAQTLTVLVLLKHPAARPHYTFKMETASSSETLIISFEAARFYNPQIPKFYFHVTSDIKNRLIIQGGAETIRRFKFSAMPTFV